MDRLINRTAKRIDTGIRQVVVVALGKAEAAMHRARTVFSRPATSTAGYLPLIQRQAQPVAVPAVRLERLAKLSPLSAAPRFWHSASRRMPGLSIS